MNSYNQFGSQWTSEKLQILRAYLNAYLLALKNQPFRKIYVDGFAGSGYIQQPISKIDISSESQLSFFDDFKDENYERLIEGSAKVVLGIDPGFDEYVFIEKKASNVDKLEELIHSYPEKRNLIRIVPGDCNEQVIKLCDRLSKSKSLRCVMFLDPYAMQIKWQTLENIAKTGVVDLWLLTPLMAINRLLQTRNEIPLDHLNILNDFFGTEDWKDKFYTPSSQSSLFSGDERQVKLADFNTIEKYYLDRLRIIFPWVAQNTYRMTNSKNSLLFSFCFVASNKSEKAGNLAKKLANQIIKKWQQNQR